MVKTTKGFLKIIQMFLKKHPLSIIFMVSFILILSYLDLLHNQIIYINLSILFIGIFAYEQTKKLRYLFLFVFVYLINEILYLLFNLDLYSAGSKTEMIYGGSEALNRKLNFGIWENASTNLTEGVFPNGKCIESDKAEQNRFDLFIQLCNIKQGEAVLDAGCGHGGLVAYLRKKGFDAYGITITKEQYKDNKQRIGDYFYFGDYTKFQPYLVNRFDHIILPGSLEHPFGGNPLHNSTYKNKYEKMSEMFSMFKKYYKKDSKSKNLLTTCIHMHPPKSKLMNTLKNKTMSYCTERHFGGCYPTYGKYSVASSMKNAGFALTDEIDKTYDYYLASHCDINHFGNPYNVSPLLLLFFPINQFAIPTYFYSRYGIWMWMWSNRFHYRRNEDEIECDVNKSCDLYYEKDFKKRPCTLYYTISKCT